MLQTGDTSIVIGHNILAYRNGLLVRDRHDRSTPPLPAYLAAVSMKAFGKTVLAAWLPFALFGLGTVILLAGWLLRRAVTFLVQAITALASLGNVSFFL